MVPPVPSAEFWRGKRVFVTGHTGFTGAWLTFWLLRLGAHVRGFALAPPTEPSMFKALSLEAHVDHQHGDVRDYPRLHNALQEHAPQIVIHLAAQPLVRQSYAEPRATFEVNALGTANLLDACRGEFGLRAVLVITTDKCYENREWSWSYREGDPLGGRDPYSASKACAEIVAEAYRQSFFHPETHAAHGITVASVRAGNLYGGGDWAVDRLIPDATRAFSSGTPLLIRNPAAVRPWQHVLDPVRAYLMLCQACVAEGSSFGRAWNIGPPPGQLVSVGELADAYSRVWSGGARYEYAQQANAPHEAGLLLLDSGLANRLLGWHPAMNLAAGLRVTTEWYTAYYRGASPDALQELTWRQITEHAAASQKQVGE